MFRVRLSDGLIESMTLAAVEAYCLGDGHGKSGLETYAYVWGYKRELEDETIFYLDRMSLSLSAARAEDSVTPSADAARLKNAIIERWSPHLTLLGDFHTHPFETLDGVLSAFEEDEGPTGGFHFSIADRESFHGDDFLWEAADDTPVHILMTICRMGKVRESHGTTPLKPHIWHYDVGEFRFWLTINVGYVEDDERYLTVETEDEVYLELDSRFRNDAGDRVAGHIERD